MESKLEKINIKVKFLTEKNNKVPEYKTAGSVGLDLLAALDKPITLNKMERAAIPTGIALVIPPGYEGQVRPRSGLALHHGITCLNTPGTIDWDYRGEIKVILINLGEDSYTIQPGDRIAQLVINKVSIAELEIVTNLEETGRNDGGFGHTGKQ